MFFSGSQGHAMKLGHRLKNWRNPHNQTPVSYTHLTLPTIYSV